MHALRRISYIPNEMMILVKIGDQKIPGHFQCWHRSPYLVRSMIFPNANLRAIWTHISRWISLYWNTSLTCILWVEIILTYHIIESHRNDFVFFHRSSVNAINSSLVVMGQKHHTWKCMVWCEIKWYGIRRWNNEPRVTIDTVSYRDCYFPSRAWCGACDHQSAGSANVHKAVMNSGIASCGSCLRCWNWVMYITVF